LWRCDLHSPNSPKGTTFRDASQTSRDVLFVSFSLSLSLSPNSYIYQTDRFQGKNGRTAVAVRKGIPANMGTFSFSFK
jgi:hypothetical protein